MAFLRSLIAPVPRPRRLTRPAFAVALVLSALPAALGAQTPTSRDSLPLDSAVTMRTLPNGLRYYIRRNARPEKRVELRLVVNAGSVLEDNDQRGLAHFVEHMAFNGTRRFRKNDIIQYLESIGVRFGADLNAYTGFDETVYILPVPTDKPGLLEKSFEILEDWATGITFDSADVAGERGVVLEEWRRGLGAGSRIRDQQFPVIFHGSRYAERLPIGLPAIIETATPGPLKRFYRDWYRPDLMAVVAVGDIDPKEVEAMIVRHFGGIPAEPNARPRPSYPVPGNDTALVTIATDPEHQLSQVQVLYKRPPATVATVADFRAQLIQILYDQILNARLGDITQRPNAPFSFAASGLSSFVRSVDAYSLATVVVDGGIQRGLGAILAEARRVDQFGFLPAELERAKTSLLRSLESSYAEREKTESGSFAGEYVDHYLNGGAQTSVEYDYETSKRLLPAITLEEVNARARDLISDRNRVIAVAAPAKSEAAVPTAVELLATFRAADTTTVARWTETVSDAPLVASAPTPGRIVKESRDTTLALHDWTLSNGVRVLLKPTDFKADEVLFEASSPGGGSLYPDADAVEAELAPLAADRGGLSSFDAIALNKKLTGKQAQAQAFVSDLTEGLSGRASAKDLETLFQLIYLRFAPPRRDSATFEAFRLQVMPIFANRAKDPNAVFGDTVMRTMSQYHPRAQPMNPDILRQVDYDRALAIYRERFADASDFTFVFVGAFDVDSMRPMVEQWLGALPGIARKETGRDVGIRTPRGVVEKRVRKGVEPRSSQLIRFTGDAPFDADARYAMRAMGDLLEMKLLDNLREALGGTYSVSVNGWLRKEPRQTYNVSISFGSSPEKADTLFRTVVAVIDSVKQSGATGEELQKVQEKQRREYEVSLRENRYWLGNIQSRIQNGEDVAGLLTYRRRIDALDAMTIRDAARRYLDPAHYARFVLLPEAAATKQ